MMTLKLETVCGNVTVSGDEDAVMLVVLNDVRAAAYAMRESYSVEAVGEEEHKSCTELIDRITGDHRFLENKTIAEINHLLEFDLKWYDGLGNPNHVIKEVK